jgi:hypothetical protein
MSRSVVRSQLSVGECCRDARWKRQNGITQKDREAVAKRRNANHDSSKTEEGQFDDCLSLPVAGDRTKEIFSAIATDEGETPLRFVPQAESPGWISGRQHGHVLDMYAQAVRQFAKVVLVGRFRL